MYHLLSLLFGLLGFLAILMDKEPVGVFSLYIMSFVCWAMAKNEDYKDEIIKEIKKRG